MEFIVKAKYCKIDDNGKQKNVTESYIIPAISFAEAELRAYAILEMIVDGDFSVDTITKSKINDYLLDDAADNFYTVKVQHVGIDEDSGKEQKVNTLILIQCDSNKSAIDGVNEDLQNMIVPYEIVSTKKEAFIEVFSEETYKIFLENNANT